MCTLEYMFKEHIIFHDKWYSKLCEGFSNDLNTGNFQCRTLQHLAKLVNTNFAFSKKEIDNP